MLVVDFSLAAIPTTVCHFTCTVNRHYSRRRVAQRKPVLILFESRTTALNGGSHSDFLKSRAQDLVCCTCFKAVLTIFGTCASPVFMPTAGWALKWNCVKTIQRIMGTADSRTKTKLTRLTSLGGTVTLWQARWTFQVDRCAVTGILLCFLGSRI